MMANNVTIKSVLRYIMIYMYSAKESRDSLCYQTLASSPGHSHIFNVSVCNIENMGVAWERG